MGIEGGQIVLQTFEHLAKLTFKIRTYLKVQTKTLAL